MWPNPQEFADLVTFTEEIFNEKLDFLWSDCYFLYLTVWAEYMIISWEISVNTATKIIKKLLTDIYYQFTNITKQICFDEGMNGQNITFQNNSF